MEFIYGASVDVGRIIFSFEPCPNLPPVGRSAKNFFGVWGLTFRGLGFGFLVRGSKNKFGQGKTTIFKRHKI